MERFAKRVLARMIAETGLQLTPERTQAFAEGMQGACSKGELAQNSVVSSSPLQLVK